MFKEMERKKYINECFRTKHGGRRHIHFISFLRSPTRAFLRYLAREDNMSNTLNIGRGNANIRDSKVYNIFTFRLLKDIVICKIFGQTITLMK